MKIQCANHECLCIFTPRASGGNTYVRKELKTTKSIGQKVGVRVLSSSLVTTDSVAPRDLAIKLGRTLRRRSIAMRKREYIARCPECGTHCKYYV